MKASNSISRDAILSFGTCQSLVKVVNFNYMLLLWIVYLNMHRLVLFV